MSFKKKMFDFGAVQCSLCDVITEGTINGVPYRGFKINPYFLGGYEEFTDNPFIIENASKEEIMEKYPDILLCHDCTVKLFQFLKVKPEWGNHPFAKPLTRCCDWGYDPSYPNASLTHIDQTPTLDKDL